MKPNFYSAPLGIRIITLLLALETLVLACWAIFITVAALQSNKLPFVPAIALGCFYLVVAGSLALAARGVAKGRGFARALTIVWQLFAVIIGIQSLLSGIWISFLVVGVSGLILILIFSKSSTVYFESGI